MNPPSPNRGVPDIETPDTHQLDDARSWRIALVALVSGAVAIGMAPVLFRWSDAGPSATAFWRLGLSYPLFLLLFQLRKRSQPVVGSRPLAVRDMVTLTLPGVCFAGDLILWHWALSFTTVANATLLANMAPIVVCVGAWIWLRERFGPTFVVGLVLALAGAGALVGVSFEIGTVAVRGDILGLASAFFYASYQLTLKRGRYRFSASRIMVWSMPAACVLLAPVSVLSGERFFPASTQGWLAVCALGIFSQFCGQGLIAYAVARLPASFAAVTLLTQPLASAVFAWLLLGEALGPVQMLGAVCVLAGIYLARRSLARLSTSPVKVSG